MRVEELERARREVFVEILQYCTGVVQYLTQQSSDERKRMVKDEGGYGVVGSRCHYIK